MPWLAFVGLSGRWCWAGQDTWLHWDGRKWKRAGVERVHAAVLRALSSLHERTDLPHGDQLVTAERAANLREQMRIVVAVDPDSVGVRR